MTMRKKMNTEISVMTWILIVLGWGVLSIVYVVALPEAWKTDNVLLSSIALGMAWFVVISAIEPFFADLQGIGGRAPVSGLRLLSAAAYGLAVLLVTWYLGLPMRLVPFKFLLGIHVLMFGALMIWMVVTSLINLKVAQVASEEEYQRQGIVDVRNAISEVEQEALMMGPGYEEVRASIARISENLRFTSPSVRTEATSVEERLLTGIQRLKDSLAFRNSLHAKTSDGIQNQDEIKKILVELENEAARRSRMTS
jgi:hypothetical protein